MTLDAFLAILDVLIASNNKVPRCSAETMPSLAPLMLIQALTINAHHKGVSITERYTREKCNISLFEQYPAVQLRCLFVGKRQARARARARANCFKLSSDKFTDNFAFRYTLLNPSLCFTINVVSRDNVMTFRFPRN